MKKLLLLPLALLFIGFSMRCEIVNDTLPTALQFGDTLLLRSTSDNAALQLPQVVLPSPQTQLFEKYVNHSISEYNGLPDITIPLYEIEVKGLKIPIALTYHASGIKYKQFDGEVGTGWSINAGGYRVSRTVYGRADDLCDFYNEEDYNSIVDYDSGEDISASNIAVSNAYLGRLSIKDNSNGRADIISRGHFGTAGSTLLDSEYDQFTYMLPTSNGHFIITDRNTRTTAIAESNRDKIQLGNFNWLNNIQLNDMQITDESGFQYLFGGANCVEAADFTSPVIYLSHYNTAWLLKNIVSPYNETIAFKYKEIQFNTLNLDKHNSYTVSDILALEREEYEVFYFNKFTPDQLESMIKTENSTQNMLYDKQLFIEEIVTDKEKIIFTRYSGVYNFLLKNIKIEDKSGNLLKEIELQYSKTGNHNLLQSVAVKNNSATDKNYTFDYYGGLGNVIDQWGYYAYLPGKSHDYGDLFLHNEFKNDDIKVGLEYKKSGLMIGSNPDIWIDRKNLSHRVPEAYTLKTIYFPTGGTTHYTYESNQYQSDGETFHGGGLRIQEIESDPGTGQPKVITRYKYGKNEDGNGVINFDKNISEECFSKNIYFVSFLQISEAERQQMFFTAVAQNRTKTYSTHPLIPEYADFSVFYNQVTTYSSAGGNSANTAIGKIISEYAIPVQYHTQDSHYGYTQDAYMDLSKGAKIPVYPSTLSHGIERIVSTYRLGEQPILTARFFLNNNNDTLKTEAYSYLSTPERMYSGIKIDQPITTDNYAPIPYCRRLDVDRWDIYCEIPWIFRWSDYNITMQSKLLNSKTEKLFTPQGIVTTTENYEYNDKYQLMKTTVQNSNNGTSISEYKYPWNFDTGIYPEMTSQNRLSPVIETITQQGNTETARIQTNYGQNDEQTKGLILPLSVQSAYHGNSTLVTEYTCDLYDNKGNILQYTGIDGVPVSYLWSYNYQYPVAEIKNAAYSQVQTALSAIGLATSTLAASTSPNMDKVNQLRTNATLPANAQVTTFTYKPLIGIETITDPRGVKVTYHYDAFGRLQWIEDDKGKKIENYDYHYKNQ
jgi:YD repeat-containing protein